MRNLNLGHPKMNRPTTRLFMLTSVDGKISTGKHNRFDFDQDIPKILGEDGLSQYYACEQNTDLWTLCSGKTLDKITPRLVRWNRELLPVTMVVCTNTQLKYDTYLALCNKYRHVIVATSALSRVQSGIDTILYEYHDVVTLLDELYRRGCRKLTIQSGGELNAAFIRAGVIDTVEIVVAPLIVGGSATPTLVDGPEIKKLSEVTTLTLTSMEGLKEGYLHLTYAVNK